MKARPQRDIVSINALLSIPGELPKLDQFDLRGPEQTTLLKFLKADLPNTNHLPALGDKFADRVLKSFPEVSAISVVFLPVIPTQSLLDRLRISVVKSSEFGLQHIYKTVWIAEARIGSRVQTIRLYIHTCHYPNVRRPQESDSAPHVSGYSMHSDYRRLMLNYPAFRAHHKVFQYITTSTHDSLQSLGLMSRGKLFEYADNDFDSEYLDTLLLEVWQARTEVSRQANRPEILLETRKNMFKSGFTVVNTTMDRQQYEESRSTTDEVLSTPSAMQTVYVALGSNVGERATMIEAACQTMNRSDIKLLRTSALYETAPMYVEDQQPFINGVCEASALLPPYSGWSKECLSLTADDRYKHHLARPTF